MIKISICIPTYNRAESLAVTLEALCQQVDGAPAEVIISDNASTDNTAAIVKEFQSRYQYIRYFRNKINIGLDDNTLEAASHATGEYIWLCSDDDIPLPGTLGLILKAIEQHSPKFVYLRLEGYFDYESYQVVTERNLDQEDAIYQDGEQMFRKYRISHFSSSVFRTDLFQKYRHLTEKYKAQNWGRGYAFVVIANYLVLSEPGPFYYIGKICIAARNSSQPDYNSDVLKYVVIDNARFYQDLRKKGLISRRTEIEAINWSIGGLYRMLLPMKCLKDPRYTSENIKLIFHYYSGYLSFYFYMLPILILPRWLLLGPYWLGRFGKKTLDKILNRSPF